MADTSASAPAPAPTVAVAEGEPKPETETELKAEDKEDEKEVDPNAIPDDACVTLYLQNLNEKVRIPGASLSLFCLGSECEAARCRVLCSLRPCARASARSLAALGSSRIPVVMKQTLLNLFKPYRPVVDVTAHKNVRMRGQAFMSFPNIEMANKARKEVAEFPLYGKPVVSFPRLCAQLAVRRGRTRPGKENQN